MREAVPAGCLLLCLGARPARLSSSAFPPREVPPAPAPVPGPLYLVLCTGRGGGDPSIPQGPAGPVYVGPPTTICRPATGQAEKPGPWTPLPVQRGRQQSRRKRVSREKT